jgi:hypothetical protein
MHGVEAHNLSRLTLRYHELRQPISRVVVSGQPIRPLRSLRTELAGHMTAAKAAAVRAFLSIARSLYAADHDGPRQRAAL